LPVNLWIAIGLAALSAPALAAGRFDFCVAPQGRDDWTGRLAAPNAAGTDGPFATLDRARRAVRKLKRAGSSQDVTVLVRGGTYRLLRPLAFGPEDGGTEAHAVTYAAWRGERPVLSGGRAIAGWKLAGGGLWTVELGEVREGKWHFTELFVNGRRARRARSPNAGFFRLVKPGADQRTSFEFRPGDLKAFKGLDGAEIVFLHDWSISRVRIASVDEQAHVVKLAEPIGSAAAHYRQTHFEPHPRYFVENARELLDRPGEWHLDRKTGLLSYLPADGEDMTRAEVVAPAIERLLEVAGDGAKGKFVEDLRFVGLRFAHCAWPRPAGGYAAGQAGFHDVRTKAGSKIMRARMPAAVAFEAARRCTFADGGVEHVGGAGLSLGAYCRDNRIAGNEIADVAGNGVMIGEPGQDPKRLARDNRVSNNYVHHCGAEFYGCVAVWAGITAGTVVAHNEICHVPYTGPTPCRANRIEFNHIHHVMQMLSDGGGIYTLGRQPETVLRGNVIHDVPRNAGRAESNGMFIDEGSSLILIEANTIHAVARSPIRFHRAEKNTIRNNVLVPAARGGPFAFNACRADSMTFQDNRILPAAVRTDPAGRVGAALLCDGAGSVLELPHAPVLEPAALTVEAWVKLPAWPGGKDPRRWIVSKNANEWQQGHYALAVSGDQAGAYLNIGGGRENCFSAFTRAGPLRRNRWHHLAMTYDGSELKVYVDGKLAAGKAVKGPRVGGRGPLSIGKRPDNYNFFTGLIDEVRLYGRALPAERIAAHHAGSEKVPADEKDLIRHWSFDELAARAELGESRTAGLEGAYRKRLLGAD